MMETKIHVIDKKTRYISNVPSKLIKEKYIIKASTNKSKKPKIITYNN